MKLRGLKTEAYFRGVKNIFSMDFIGKIDSNQVYCRLFSVRIRPEMFIYTKDINEYLLSYITNSA